MLLRRWLFGAVVLAGLGVAGGAVAGERPAKAPREPKAPRAAKPAKVIEGETVAREVADLVKEIPWRRDLDAALAEAKSKGRMVLWAHTLGALDGDT